VVGQAGQWAEYFGWLHIAGKRCGEANQWFSRSLEWAIEAEDDDLAATAWSFKGELAWRMGKIGPTIGLTRFARRYRKSMPGRVPTALCRRHAAVGDAYPVEQLVDESYELAEKAPTRPGKIPDSRTAGVLEGRWACR